MWPSWTPTHQELLERGDERIHHVLAELLPPLQPTNKNDDDNEKMARKKGDGGILVQHSHGDATWDESVQRMEVGSINNPGIAIRWADDATLHACLGFAGAPIPQSANATASGVALRAWFAGLVAAVHANCRVVLAEGIASSQFFDHVSIAGYGAITQALLAPPIMAWWAPLHAAGLSAGRFYMVTRAGRDRNRALQRTFVPFL